VNAIQSGVNIPLVLTPNERLARTLREQHDLRQMRAGAAVWESATVHSWDGWLESCWNEWGVWLPGPQLLHPEQDALLWEQVVSESEAGSRLLNVRATARLARQTRALMLSYGVPVEIDPGQLNEDQLVFQAWHTRFREFCREANLIDRAALPEHLGSLTFPHPAEIRLSSFDEITPQQKSLLKVMRERGSLLKIQPESAVAESTAVRSSFASSDDELWTAAGWLCQRLQKHGPRQRLGLVLPDLASARTRIQQIFAELLGPDSPDYNLSLGQPLAQYPVVRAACRALALLKPRVSFEDLSAVLRSPFFGGDTLDERALLELKLRKLHIPTLPLADYLGLLGSEAPELRAALGQLVAGGEARPSQWARRFDDALRSLGWPGNRMLDAAEIQTVERFRQRLYDLSALDVFAGEQSLEEVLTRLQGWLEQTSFQPSGRPRAPIQILGLLEAAGQQFDALWVAGLDDASWPAPARPNPYLPLSIQRGLAMPHCSPEHELEFAVRLTERLRSSAGQVVFSSPLAADGQALRPSRLLDELQLLEFPADTPGTRAQRMFNQRPGLESWADEQGPALAPGRARGGSRIFQLQAACAFQAFAVLRLRSEAPETVSHGLSAGERGSLVHQVLEHVWGVLKSSERLASLGPNELESLARLAATEAVQSLSLRRPDVLRGRFRELEIERMTRLVLDWLELERERELPFEVIATEQKRRVQLGGLSVDVIVDRIDQVGPLEGRRGENPVLHKIVLDYKTGLVSQAHWDGNRPEAPQLPLYAATAPVHGVAFANVRRPRFRFQGSCEESRALPGTYVHADFATQRQDWKGVLESLASQFLEGRAEVDPKAKTTCQFCHLAGLCRIGQRA
jgi:ATP-dependent helicase/nuclease subunit B